jgi:putative phage-type endonuclease
MNEFIPQGSPQWIRQRVGKVTASRIADVPRGKKGASSAARESYILEVLYEWVTDRAYEHYVSAPMQWGTDHQEEGIRTYTLVTGNEVRPAPFVQHPVIANSGASPDGYVDIEGLVEVKCPTSVSHLGTLLIEEIPAQYALQMQWQMECSERGWCDFVSFDPRLPPGLQFWSQRLERDEKVIAMLREEVQLFLADIRDRYRHIQARLG